MGGGKGGGQACGASGQQIQAQREILTGGQLRYSPIKTFDAGCSAALMALRHGRAHSSHCGDESGLKDNESSRESVWRRAQAVRIDPQHGIDVLQELDGLQALPVGYVPLVLRGAVRC